jgi:hypothetical protein
MFCNSRKFFGKNLIFLTLILFTWCINFVSKWESVFCPLTYRSANRNYNFIPRWVHEHPVQLETVSNRVYRNHYTTVAYNMLHHIYLCWQFDGSWKTVDRKGKNIYNNGPCHLDSFCTNTCALHKFLVTSESTGTNNGLAVIWLTVQMNPHVTLQSSKELYMR